MSFVQRYARAVWPTPSLWLSILRGASRKLGLDDQHTLLCHLAQRVSRRDHVDYSVAYDFVSYRIVTRVEALLHEFVSPGDAEHVAALVRTWLATLGFSRSTGVFWPTRAEWLAIDRAAAARAFFDGQFTLSAHLAARAIRLGVPKSHAMQWVHQRIAVHARLLAEDCGYGWFSAWVIGERLRRALDSFERQ
jgi:hypothetical protein